MTWQKRSFDLAFALLALIPIAPAIAVIAILIWCQRDGPVFYISKRMKSPSEPFELIKFRTMRADGTTETGVTGADKAARVTRLGAVLRRFRVDEFPQLWNLLRGDISVVGPRPPLPEYVDRFPAIYAQVLRSRPGLTGLATLHFHKREQALLGQTRNAAETDHVYTTRCIPRKARLDLIYQRRASLCFDLVIFCKTLKSLFA